MKPESQASLARSQELLDRAPALPAQDFTDEAGRAAYLAGFHAAQALIFERRGRSSRTRSGVQTQFALLTQDEATIDRELRAFRSLTYELKATADYETGSRVAVTQAAEAIAEARRFVAAIVALMPEAPAA